MSMVVTFGNTDSVIQQKLLKTLSIKYDDIILFQY